MSSMAKIFVVVNLILAVVAFGSAATLLGAKEDYKAANAEMTKKFEAFKSAKEQEIQRINNQLTSQTNLASTAVAAKGNAEDKAQSYMTQLAEAKQANQKLTATADQQSNTLKALQETNNTYKDWLDRLTNENKSSTQAQMNVTKKWEDEVNNRVRLESEVSKAAEELQSLAAKCGDLEKNLRDCRFWLDKYRERFGDIGGGGKGAAGVVKQVRNDLVMISVGSNDGVRTGDIYQIRRGSDYVGQVTITHVYKDLAAGKFDTEFRGPKGLDPQAGDVAEPRKY